MAEVLEWGRWWWRRAHWDCAFVRLVRRRITANQRNRNLTLNCIPVRCFDHRLRYQAPYRSFWRLSCNRLLRSRLRLRLRLVRQEHWILAGSSVPAIQYLHHIPGHELGQRNRHLRNFGFRHDNWRLLFSQSGFRKWFLRQQVINRGHFRLFSQINNICGLSLF